MLCLVVTAVAITAVIVWLFFRILDGTKVSKPADDADNLETDELPDRDDVDDLQPTPAPQPKTWVAEIILPKDDSKQPTYFFHCPNLSAGSSQGITYGKHYLYSGRGFVTTDNPATAILLQQLLNEGQLNVKPFNPETNDLSK